MKNNKNIKLIISIIAFLVAITSITFAFFIKYNFDTENKVNTDLNLSTDDYLFVANYPKNISISKELTENVTLNIGDYVFDNGTAKITMSSLNKDKLLTCSYDLYYVWDSNERYTTPDVQLNDSIPFEYSIVTYKNNEIITPEKDLSNYEFTLNETSGKYETKIIENDKLYASKNKYEYNIDIQNRVYNLLASQNNIFNKNLESHIELRNVSCALSDCENSVCDNYR